ncbi:DeoR/GlpR family DNA-binding transcription regulator [Cellulomonas fimi]|uniref:Lactose phosphotransferase system repressor n=1 Tax=Cellulomonas fimi TaxID=1708 RepID=A0A7Y0QFZ9_CELFI|nr:DeoR/GlpR family DNA-binding transcription regulator [Cellulomonas fimi]NMR19576.1 DeoR/GlpR transcriptional regulator [Cellulomonas fimi]
MFAHERQDRIADVVADRGRVTVAELAAELDVTPETVRRDLDTLEGVRRLRRVHGGAVAMHRVSLSEPSLLERRTQRLDEKNRIADAALALVPAGRAASVILDAGTTTERLADRLATWRAERVGDELLVITNALPIASVLAASVEIQLDLLGGRVRGLTSALVGPTTTRQLDALRADVAFVGANGLTADFGLSTPDSAEAAVKAAMVRSARRVVALVDSSKLGEDTLVRFATLDQIDALVTDDSPPPDLARALAEAEVEVVVA